MNRDILLAVRGGM